MNSNTFGKILVIGFLILLFSTACGTSQADLDATATKAMAKEFAKKTEEAPTATPLPTDTPVPTYTPAPSDTPEPTPTSTASPTPTITNTPAPTNTPEPTVPPEPTLGELMFFDEDFEEAKDEFQLGVTMVYACFEYWSMSPNLRVSGYAYHNGNEFGNISGFYDLEGNDGTCFSLSRGGGRQKLEAGQYKIKMYIENDLATEGEFKILR